MSALTSYLHILSCLLLLILFIAIPGYAAARTLRLRCRDMLDFVLICFGLGSPGAASVFMPCFSWASIPVSAPS